MYSKDHVLDFCLLHTYLLTSTCCHSGPTITTLIHDAVTHTRYVQIKVFLKFHFFLKLYLCTLFTTTHTFQTYVRTYVRAHVRTCVRAYIQYSTLYVHTHIFDRYAVPRCRGGVRRELRVKAEMAAIPPKQNKSYGRGSSLLQFFGFFFQGSALLLTEIFYFSTLLFAVVFFFLLTTVSAACLFVSLFVYTHIFLTIHTTHYTLLVYWCTGVLVLY